VGRFHVRRQKVVIEYNDGGWLAMFDDGTVRAFETAEKAFRAVQREANRKNKEITVTTIEWRGAPVGFEPPKNK
jgi:hypothetical protein